MQNNNQLPLDFLNPNSMLTPGIAGGLTMLITNALGGQFELPLNYTCLGVSTLFGALVWVTSAKPWAKIVYWVLNTLIIFSMAVGVNTVGLRSIAQIVSPISSAFASNSTSESVEIAFFKNWFDSPKPKLPRHPTKPDRSSEFGDTSPVLKRINERGVINVGYSESSVPFAYIGPDGKPIGYTIDLCIRLVEKIKITMKMPDIKLNYVPVTAQTRIPLLVNGTIDMVCDSTSISLTRQKQVDFLPVTFITGTKLASKKGSGIKEIEDLNGKAIALAQGTTNEKAIKRVMKEKGIKIKIITVKDHPQGWLALETGRVDAYATDDVLLYELISKSKNPGQFQVTGRFLSYDPYGLMVPRNDPTLRRLGSELMADLMRSGEILKIYNKWFNPGPTKIKIPLNDSLRSAFEVQALPY